MKELREKLSNNYMTISEYFNESSSFLKFLFKKGFTRSSLPNFLIVVVLISIFNFLFLPICLIFRGVLIRKIIETIEGKESISNNKFFGKIFSYFSVLFLFLVIFFKFFIYIPYVRYFMLLIVTVFYYSYASEFMLCIALILLFIGMNFLIYFDISYFSRDISILEAFKYNLRTFKGQRLKKFIPFIFLVISILISVFSFLLLIKISMSLTIILGSVPSLMSYFITTGLFLISILLFLMVSLLSFFYFLVLSCIIYLNVEYMDLNKQYDGVTKKTNIENSSQDNLKSINFIFRKSEEKDIDKIVEILEKAKIEIKKLGINQWQKGYPNRDVILTDIKNGNSYIIEDEEKIVATAALIFEKESPYSNISEGKWITDSDYGVIHRIAVDSEFKNRGYSSKLLKKLEEVSKEKLVYSIKIDTHEDNKPMQRLLEKNGYVYCGIIYLDKEPSIGEKRMAFEKVLEK